VPVRIGVPRASAVVDHGPEHRARLVVGSRLLEARPRRRATINCSG
jgi:hypothetical protein